LSISFCMKASVRILGFLPALRLTIPIPHPIDSAMICRDRAVPALAHLGKNAFQDDRSGQSFQTLSYADGPGRPAHRCTQSDALLAGSVSRHACQSRALLSLVCRRV
jgi:hypothetical protein